MSVGVVPYKPMTGRHVCENTMCTTPPGLDRATRRVWRWWKYENVVYYQDVCAACAVSIREAVAETRHRRTPWPDDAAPLTQS